MVSFLSWTRALTMPTYVAVPKLLEPTVRTYLAIASILLRAIMVQQLWYVLDQALTSTSSEA
jgi:hypothetical protein